MAKSCTKISTAFYAIFITICQCQEQQADQATASAASTNRTHQRRPRIAPTPSTKEPAPAARSACQYKPRPATTAPPPTTTTSRQPTGTACTWERWRRETKPGDEKKEESEGKGREGEEETRSDQKLPHVQTSKSYYTEPCTHQRRQQDTVRSLYQ